MYFRKTEVKNNKGEDRSFTNQRIITVFLVSNSVKMNYSRNSHIFTVDNKC